MQKSSPKAISLVEVIIAITIFSILLTIGINLLDQVSKASRKVEMEEYLYTETQQILEKIGRTIQSSAIDYEEYYNRFIVGDTLFGTNYGDYHMQFFNPGSDGAYGGICTDGSEYSPESGCPVGEFPDINSFDYETGMNPYDGNGDGMDEDNAFCSGDVAFDCSTNPGYHQVKFLALINKAGDEKTIFILEDISGGVPQPGAAISVVKMEGTDSDGNGLIDTWACTGNYNCTGLGNHPKRTDRSNGRDTNDFYPLTPENITIESLNFYISPIEDPFKGYNETDSSIYESVQIHPKVTIVITARYQLYDSVGTALNFGDTANFGEAPEITLQTTVGTGVFEEIPAYTFP